MVLIGEVQEPTGHAALLEHIKQGNALGDREPEIVIVVDDEVGGAELEDVLRRRGVVATVVVSVVPEGAVELLRLAVEGLQRASAGNIPRAGGTTAPQWRSYCP